jgi:FkbM family methyltransferase
MATRVLLPAALLLALLLALLPAAVPRALASDAYTWTEPSRDGIGKVYMGREISQVMGHRGAGWLERPGREREERPQRVVEALDLEPDDVVADVGAGTGYFTFRIAPRVPEGRVLAVDIQPQMLERIETRMRREGVDNVQTILGAASDPRLAPDSLDVALVVDAYHEFSHPREMAQALRKALRPRGRLVLVEYRGEDPDVAIKPLHKMTEAQVRKELEAAGLRFVRTVGTLPTQHILVFERPD